MANVTLGTLWSDYASKVIPPNASDVQVSETQRAFYAGVYSILTAMARQVGDEDHATEVDMAMVDGFFTEAEQFLASKLQAPSA
jgi:hypothetical protein